MTDGVTLTEAQLRSYWQDGFVRLGPILSTDQLAALRAEEARFRAGVQYSLADGKTVLPDKSSTIFRNQLANYSEPVREIYLRGRHLNALRPIVGPTACGSFNQFVTKLPDANLKTAEFPWHQDNGYGGNDAKTNVTVWCALDDVDEQNGCVWVVPGSHQLGLLDHSSSGTSWHLTVKAPNDGVPVPLKAGEAVAFSGLTLHRSLANRTDKPRRAFFMQYGDYAQDSRAQSGHGVVTSPLFLAYGALPYPRPPAQETIDAKKPIRLLFAGDSITGYSDLSQYLKFSHIIDCMIEARWGANHAVVLNHGKGGDTTTDLLSRFRADVLDAKPDVAVLLIGGNDAAQKTPPDTTANLERILAELRAVCPRVLVLQYHVLPRPDCPEKAWSHLDDNNDAIAAAAARHGCPVLNMAPVMRAAVDDTVPLGERDFRRLPAWSGIPRYRTCELVGVDGVHLMFGGELVFARAIFAKLVELKWLERE